MKRGRVRSRARGGELSRTSWPQVRRPLIGAEIMDDPAATEEFVDRWFKTLADHDMPLARVFIPRETDFHRMDWFFRAAERYRVGITATLGGSPSLETEEWIKLAVNRYKDSPALDSWILMNEPGHAPDGGKLAVDRFRGWLQNKYTSIHILNQAWHTQFTSFYEIEYDPRWNSGDLFSNPAPFLEWHTFWRNHLTWHLEWLADQVRKADTAHPLHTNPHGLVGNLACLSQDLPSWRSFLNSLGSSIHPSWHFGLLDRDQYAMGVSYVCDLVRGASLPNPTWITELQGGNNTNSGIRPLCPLPRDIAQWVWTGIGSGVDRVIFWLLNSRSYGGESGEWSLLDFQHQPTDRLETAGRIAKALEKHSAFFRGSHPETTPITILLSLETMTLQERFEKTQPVISMERGTASRLEGRGRNAHVLEALSFYEAFQDLGIPVEIKHMHDFSWGGTAFQKRLAILPNIAALSLEQAEDIARFLRNGNSAIITGLTGAWDPENRFWPLTSEFPLANVLGATLKEIRTLDEGQTILMAEPRIALPLHLWCGEIRNVSARVAGRRGGWITAVKARTGKGEALWIPSLIGMGAWLGDSRPLTALIQREAGPFILDLPFRFKAREKRCVLRTLRNGRSFVTIVTNGTAKARRVSLAKPKGLTSTPVWLEESKVSKSGEMKLGPRGTAVLLWK